MFNSHESPIIIFGWGAIIISIVFLIIVFCAPDPEPKPTENIENTVGIEAGLKLVRTEHEIEALLREMEEHSDSAAVYENVETGQRYLIVTTHHSGISVTLLDSIEPDTQDIGE